MKPTSFTLHLAVQYAIRRKTLPTRPQLRRWVAAALLEAGIKHEVQLVLRFVDADEGQTLNRDFRQRDYATNVLTFPYDEPDIVAGDIVLCVPVVEREAREQRKKLAHHYAHMVMHGVLHACGYDHENARDAAGMEALETKALARFAITDPYL